MAVEPTHITSVVGVRDAADARINPAKEDGNLALVLAAVDGVEGLLTAANSLLTAIQSNTASIHLDTDQLEAKVDAATAAVNAFKGAFDGRDLATETTLAGIKARTDNLDITLSAFRDALRGTSTRDFTTLQTAVTAIQSSVDAFKIAFDVRHLATSDNQATMIAFLTSIDAKVATEATLLAAKTSIETRLGVLGQKFSAGSTPAVLSFEQEAILTAIRDFRPPSLQVTGTGNALDATPTPATDVSRHSTAYIQITDGGSPFTATVLFEGSNDGVTWFPVNLTQAGTIAGLPVTSAAAAGLYWGALSAARFRTRLNPFTSGTVTVKAVFVPAGGGGGGSGGTSKQDKESFTPAVDRLVPIGGLAQTAVPDAAPNNTAVAAALTLHRAVHVSPRNDDGTERILALESTAAGIRTDLGTDGATPPSIAGTGVRGWLRGIYDLIVVRWGTLGQKASVGSAPVTLSTEQEVFLTQTRDSLGIIDDWDEADRAKVNPIVGQAGVEAGSGVVTAKTQRMVLATDVPLPAGSNLLGKTGVDLTTPGTTNRIAPIAGQDGVAAGAGAVGANTQRMTLASDDPAVVALGTDGASPPSIPGTGVRGWLRSLYDKIVALSKSEDAAHVSGDQGIMDLGVRNDGGTTVLTGANGRYGAKAINDRGSQFTSFQDSLIMVPVDVQAVYRPVHFTSSTPLAGSASVSSTPQAMDRQTIIEGSAFANVVGVLVVYGSEDGVNYNAIATYIVAASVLKTFSCPIPMANAYVTYTNGAVAQATFRIRVTRSTI